LPRKSENATVLSGNTCKREINVSPKQRLEDEDKTDVKADNVVDWASGAFLWTRL
jgi:hypothetical protein